MLADSKAKIEYIKMRRMKAKQSQTENGLDAEGKPKGEECFTTVCVWVGNVGYSIYAEIQT